jgi:NADPH2 dehydrogenase
MQPLPTPHPLTADEISETIEDYRKAAQNALEAGFDGVELHAANGYLIDQFLQDSTNHREDQYGGPVKNRVRFLTEVLDAVLTVWEPGRVGVHLAPKGDTHDMGDSDLEGLFLHVARELGARKIAFICARESYDGTEIGPKLKEAFGGVYVANQGFTRESAQSTLASDGADAVAWGKLFIANPDLPHRFEVGSELNEPDPATFYAAEGTEPEPGYIDYPPLESERKLAHKG